MSPFSIEPLPPTLSPPCSQKKRKASHLENEFGPEEDKEKYTVARHLKCGNHADDNSSLCLVTQKNKEGFHVAKRRSPCYYDDFGVSFNAEGQHLFGEGQHPFGYEFATVRDCVSRLSVEARKHLLPLVTFFYVPPPAAVEVIILEHAVGGDLFDLTTNTTHTKQNMNLCSTLIRQVLLGLRELHSRGWVHRDMKLENCVLMQPFDCEAFEKKGADAIHVRIIDFETTSRKRVYTAEEEDEEEKTFSSPCFGFTRLYAPPENAHDDLERMRQDAPVDMWAVGCMLWILYFAERQPFGCVETSPGNYGFKDERNGTDWSSKLGVPDSLRDVLAGLLENDPAKRITVEQALQMHFFAVK
jgi:serine/threonine protein kinase